MVTSFILRLLPLLSDQAVHFQRQRRHFVHALLPGHAGAVGAVGQLVGVVAQASYPPAPTKQNQVVVPENCMLILLSAG